MSRNYELLRGEGEQPRSAIWVNNGKLGTPLDSAENATLRDSEPNISALLDMLRRRRHWIIGCTVFAFCAAAIACFLLPPTYQAQSTIEVLPPDPAALGAGNESNGSSASPAADVYLNLQTQLAVLQSDTLAWQVMRELNLVRPEEVPTSLAPTSENAQGVLVQSSQVTRNSNACGVLDRALSRTTRPCLVAKFESRLKVSSVPGTRLITVAFSDRDPVKAANVVNRLISKFIDYSFQVHYDATKQQTDWLARQLVDLKAQVESSQERAVQLQRESGIFGADEGHNIVLTRLEHLNDELTSAEADRVTKETVYRLAKTGSPELISGMLGTQTGGSAQQNGTVASQLNSLRQQESVLDAQYAEASAKFGPEYPRLVQLRQQRESVKSTIEKEIDKIRKRAKNEYELASARESAARNSFTEQKAIAANMNDKAVNYLIAKHEAESGRTLYEQLLRKLKEANVLAGLRSNELHVIDAAEVPEHSKPRAPLFLGLGTLAGLLLGLVGATIAEGLDQTVGEVTELEKSAIAPVMAVVPIAATAPARRPLLRSSSLFSEPSPTSGLLQSMGDPAVREAFRGLRTNLLLCAPDNPMKVVLVTSGIPGEGKTFTSFNVAATFSRSGTGDVLLVDADLRCCALTKYLGGSSSRGLAELLATSAPVPPDYARVEGVPGLYFLASGACDDVAPEMLTSERVKALVGQWRQRFSMVVIDSPPVLPVSDALVLSKAADTVVLVVRASMTSLQSVARSVRVLRDVQVHRIGVVLNGVDITSPEYNHYFGVNYGRYRQQQAG